VSYGIGIAAACCGVLVGIGALHVNDVSHDTDFATTMVTTCNSVLDEMAVGSSHGAKPVRDELLNTRLKFGVLRAEHGDLLRTGFGAEGQVSELKMGRLSLVVMSSGGRDYIGDLVASVNVNITAVAVDILAVYIW